MKPKSNRKLNQKIQSFFQKRKAVSISPQAILSKSDFDRSFNRNKFRMFWHQHKSATLNYLRLNLRKITYRFSRPGRMEAKLKRMRARIIREEDRISSRLREENLEAELPKKHIKIPSILQKSKSLLTPRQKENIVQIIINNFMDIFGWAKLR